jgi:hypothetical protein
MVKMKTASSKAEVKIKMMKASVRCLIFGLLSLLPVIGVPFALAGFWSSFSARKSEKYFWNPARPQRIIGLLCAALGGLIWGGVDTVLIYHALNLYVNV